MINSAGGISSRMSDFLREHSAARITHFQAEFEQNTGKSVNTNDMQNSRYFSAQFARCSSSQRREAP